MLLISPIILLCLNQHPYHEVRVTLLMLLIIPHVVSSNLSFLWDHAVHAHISDCSLICPFRSRR